MTFLTNKFHLSTVKGNDKPASKEDWKVLGFIGLAEILSKMVVLRKGHPSFYSVKIAEAKAPSYDAFIEYDHKHKSFSLLITHKSESDDIAITIKKEGEITAMNECIRTEKVGDSLMTVIDGRTSFNVIHNECESVEVYAHRRASEIVNEIVNYGIPNRGTRGSLNSNRHR